MFPTKLTKLQVRITFFWVNTQQQILCILNSEKNLFQLSWELDRLKAIIPLPGSVLASPENIQTEASRDTKWWPLHSSVKLKGAHAVGIKYRHQSTFSPVSLLNITFPPATWTKVIFYIDKSYIDKDFLSKYRQGKSFLFYPHILNRNIILGLGNSPGTNAVHFSLLSPLFKDPKYLQTHVRPVLIKANDFILRSRY